MKCYSLSVVANTSGSWLDAHHDPCLIVQVAGAQLAIAHRSWILRRPTRDRRAVFLRDLARAPPSRRTPSSTGLWKIKWMIALLQAVPQHRENLVAIERSTGADRQLD